ncbi:putative membrane protein [Leifsonia sp. 98AMF]|uniref:YhgE/Pip family protein n=1 Tax=unclassified Leifsonia TaxID=2663824 RepID=UPI00087B32F6|nr:MULTISPECIES: YhgE/Pip family protein [unclassified Leifsonia]SDH28691.1 putative membrane protein [Leifsonia sp. 197AMF]SDJ09415.1 putative membrane protein [Leifsonia sp. 466MF]SDJ61266.1 putative membrane protein [Leifsonia sp. 157MF]SDN30592.1 putative membrane protein [Leifsonia sp. 509MF]SEM90612.1 putative membrane protein [Leifsonia sp. 467MF]
MTTPSSRLRRPRSLFSLERMRSDKRVTWLTIVGLLLVPITIGGLLVWALWNPTERLHDVKAAVVNLDQPVTVNGQTVPLGRQLSAGLLDSKNDNFTWVLTDKKDADKGINSGEYVSVVTIPENFSKAATSTAGAAADATQATIDVRTSPDSKLVDPAISQAVTTTATSVLNKQLTSTYIENVYVGFNTLGEQLGKAATGADQLAGGLTQLASGTHQLADGAAQLSTGASSLADGISQLSDGTSGLADGLNTLASNGAAVDGGAQQLAGTAATMSSSLTTATNGINAAVAQNCAPPADPAVGALCAQLSAQLKDLNTAQAYGAGLASGTQTFAGQLGQYTGGVSQSASGAQQLASGASQSADGAQQFATGVKQLSDGIPALASGADQSASGASSLASGLHTAVKQLPSYDSGERTSLAKVAAEPVTQKASGETAFGTASIPLFASVALWLGALATFLVLQALSRRALLTSRAAGRIALDGFLPAAALGVVQGVLVAAVLAPALAVDAGHWFGFAGLAAAAGIAFAAVNHGLVALLGGVGRFLSMLVVVVTLASGIVSTAPGFFDAALPWLPTAPAITALQGAIDGSADAWRGLGGLLLWAAFGFALALIAVARRRVVRAAQLLPAE